MLLLLALALALDQVSSHPLVLANITVEAPVGTSNHGEKHLLCRPTRATDVLVFFLGNYVAHVATVKRLPGQTIPQSLLSRAFAFFFPSSGIVRGLRCIV